MEGGGLEGGESFTRIGKKGVSGISVVQHLRDEGVVDPLLRGSSFLREK